MLEFFVVTSFVEKYNNYKKEENKKIKEMFNDNFLTTNELNVSAINFVMGFVALVISLYTAMLAYQCNKKADAVLQVVITLFAFFFSGTYLLYYFIWHVFLKNKC